MSHYNETFEAIGTRWQIETSLRLSDVALKEISTCIETFDAMYSRFRQDSVVTAMARQAGTYHFSADIVPLLSFYRTLYDITEGRVTPLIGSMLERAGYDAVYSFQPTPQTELPDWDAAMALSGTTLTTSQPITLDIGAAGKGYLIDKIASILDQHRIMEYVVDGSGDITHKGELAEIIGLEHPTNPSKIIGTASIKNQSICASASNRRRWGGDTHHIFDPTTKAPAREVVATWAITKQAMIADGIATALFFTEPETLLTAFDFEYVRVHRNNTVDHSSSFNGEVFV